MDTVYLYLYHFLSVEPFCDMFVLFSPFCYLHISCIKRYWIEILSTRHGGTRFMMSVGATVIHSLIIVCNIVRYVVGS